MWVIYIWDKQDDTGGKAFVFNSGGAKFEDSGLLRYPG